MDLETKRLKRKENKKRKIEALLLVSDLNDSDTKRMKKETGDKPIKDNNQNESVSIDSSDVQSKGSSDNSTRISDKPLLSGQDYEDLKKRLRERKKRLTCIPQFRLKSVGEEASVNLSKRVPLFMSDVQNLINFSLIGDRAPYWPHRWSVLTKWNRLSNIVVLVIDGIGIDDLSTHKDDLKWLPSHIPNMLEIVSPLSYHSSIAEELALIPLTVVHKEKLIQKFGSLESAIENEEAFKVFRSIFPVISRKGQNNKKIDGSPKMKLLLSATQMVVENYPLPLPGLYAEEKFKDFILTKESYSEVTPDSPLYSIDCEMCMTDEGSELTRICVVDATLAVVYHTLVKPRNKIRNYLTQYSGITEQMLEGVTTRLEDVQKALQELLPSDAILVGQSLNGDLAALKMMHPYIIDTSVCFNITGDRRRKTKLSVLCHLFLNRTIQNQGKLGHNPIEDAQAAMNLVVLKLEKGIEFGDVILGGEIPRMDENGIYKIGPSSSKLNKKDNLMTPLSKALSEHEKSVALICDTDSAVNYQECSGFMSGLKEFKSEKDFSEIVELASAAAVDHDFTLCHVNLSELEIEKKIKKTKKISKKLYEHTSVNGMFVILLGGTTKQNGVAGIVIKKPEITR